MFYEDALRGSQGDDGVAEDYGRALAGMAWFGQLGRDVRVLEFDGGSGWLKYSVDCTVREAVGFHTAENDEQGIAIELGFALFEATDPAAGDQARDAWQWRAVELARELRRSRSPITKRLERVRSAVRGRPHP